MFEKLKRRSKGIITIIIMITIIIIIIIITIIIVITIISKLQLFYPI